MVKKTELSDEYRDRLAKVKLDSTTVDTSILTPDDIAALELQAEDEILADRKEAAKKAKLAQLKTDMARRHGVQEALETVTIDLAPYCDRVLIDNQAFLQGQTYTLPVSQVQVIREMIQRTWGHQSEIDGKSENFYRKGRGAHVGPNGAVTTRSNLLRA
jgi:hypothetical protein